MNNEEEIAMPLGIIIKESSQYGGLGLFATRDFSEWDVVFQGTSRIVPSNEQEEGNVLI